MAFSAACPSCGAPVSFKSAASYHAVCAFCRSTLVRQDGNLENLGRMAELLPDASRLRLGTEGSFRGVHFALIGRIQLKTANALWNEWYLLFDDQRGGWLSDAGGEYLLSFLTPPGIELPPFANVAPDRMLRFAGRDWTVTHREEALCIAGEGELPFAFGAGYPAPLVDLRTTDDSGGFASIDYSESPPLCFVGEVLPFEALRLSNLRDEATPARKVKAQALSCPSCGGAITLHDEAIRGVACPSCLTVLKADDGRLAILQKAQAAKRIEPKLPLGSVGRFGGVEWTVIGFQERAVTAEGIAYPWQEYLLHHPDQGFRWLVDSSGHWSWVTPLAKRPTYRDGSPTLRFEGDEFVRYAAGKAVTRYVVGEFNWRVEVGEEWDTLDLVAPPRMLSRERGEGETSWSLGDYLPVEELAAAFGIQRPLPAPRGVGANQPNPRREPHRRTCRRFWLFAAVAVVMQLGWWLFGSRTLVEQRVLYSHEREESVVTPSFRIDRPLRTLALNHDTNLSNNWVGLGITLVEKQSGRAWAAGTELSYWHGSDGGESWSEGSASRELLFRDIPAGEYYFVIDPEMSDENRAPVVDTLRAVGNPVPWSNAILLLLFLAAFPLLSRLRVASFEGSRWSDADFTSSGLVPTVSDDSDDDGDD